MTKDEALNIAIDYMNERLEEHDAKFQRHPVAEAERNNILADIEAVKEALAQPEQEPRCEAIIEVFGKDWRLDYMSLPVGKHKLYTQQYTYTTPPQRKPLTDEEIWDEVKAADLDWQTGWSLDEDASNRYITFARAIEAAHGIKELV